MFLAYLYLIRVPLLCATVAVVIRAAALSDSGLAQLVSGFFDLTALRAAVVSACIAFFAAACTVTTDLTVLNARARFRVARLPEWMKLDAEWLAHFGVPKSLYSQIKNRLMFTVGFYLLLAVYILSGITGSAFGVAVGVFAIIYVVLWQVFARVLLYPGRTFVGVLVMRGIKALAAWTPKGYTQDTEGNPVGEMPDYHAGAFIAMLISFGFYFAAFLWGSIIFPVPALASVLLLLTFLCWILSGIAFLTDRFRVPLLVILAVLLAYSGTWPEADHTFAIREPRLPLPAPGQVIAATSRPASATPQPPDAEPAAPRFIAVAASGGGIHAAAWTARIIGGLYLELPEPELRQRFANSIRVISPVSGGSVGTLYILNAYLQDGFREGTFDAQRMEEFLFNPAAESSLDAIVQKLVFEDTWRTLVPPIPLTADRGKAAEDAWLAAVPEPYRLVDADRQGAAPDNPLSAPLGQWAKLAAAGQAPAVLFNSTVVDTGERAVFASAGFSGDRAGRRLLQELYQPRGVDVAAVTAARLSATFPVVSPSARAEGTWGKSRRYHFVDGGYYDNYGMATLIEWLNDGLSQQPDSEVLLMQIRDSPVPAAAAAAKGESGFLAQAFSSLFTLLRFRDTGQVAHGNLESELLAGRFAGNVAIPESGDATHIPALFAWPQATAPLSWHLTQDEKDEIARSYSDASLRDAKRSVCLFLARPDAELIRACEMTFGR